MRRHVAILLTAASALALPASARAGTGGAQAEALFREGKALLAAGKTAEACAAFEESQKLDPTVSTLLNHASCREKNNQLATAWGLFLEAERQTRAATDAPTKKLRKVAADHAGRIEPRLSKLTINVPADNRIDRLEILRGTDVVDEAQWGRALPIDGGSYKITARAPAMGEWSAEVTVGAENDAKTVDVPKLQSAPVASAPGASTPANAAAPASAAPAAGQPAAVIATSTSAPASPAAAPRSNLVPFALAGGAVAALAGALAFDLWGDSTYDRAKAEPNPMTQDDLWHSANNKRYAAEGLAVVGIGCAGAAAWFFFHGRAAETATSNPPAAAHLIVAPFAGGDRAGLGVGGRF